MIPATSTNKAGPSAPPPETEVRPHKRPKLSGTPASKNPVLVDSGLGGALAGMSIGGAVKQFGSVVCLPIGDKTPAQIATYTAQMVAQGLIGMRRDNVIIACNTASTTHEHACKALTDFVLRQNAAPDQSIFPRNSPEMGRIHDLAARILQAEAQGGAEAKYGVVKGMVHEIVSPTASRAADLAGQKLLADPHKRDFLIVVDSTAGTAKSQAYPNKIGERLDSLMQAAGYSRTNAAADAMSDRSETETHVVQKHVFEYKKAGAAAKRLLVESRGNKAWVPAIEGNQLGQYASAPNGGPSNKGRELARASREAGNAVQIPGRQDLMTAFGRAPDLNLMCCTHYPAMKDALEADWAASAGGPPQAVGFLQQNTIVAEMAHAMMATQTVGVVDENPTLDISLGKPVIDDAEAANVRTIINQVFPDSGVTLTVSGIGQDGVDTLNAEHKDMEFRRESNGAAHLTATFTEAGTRRTPEQEAQGVRGWNSFWKQDLTATPTQDRASARFVAGISTSPVADRAKPALDKAAQFLAEQGVDKTTLRQTLQKVASLGRLITQGERRGLDILAHRQEPGIALFTATTRIAQTIRENLDRSGSAKQQVGIVTGFTVVDGQGAKVAGENDGPPGAVIMAKAIWQAGTPVTMVCDTGSQASVFAAVKAAGLIAQDGNAADVSARDKTFDNARFPAGFAVEVVDHGPGSNAANPKTVQDVRDTLAERNTGLLISIERPSPSLSGRMSSMAAADISQYNVDMSPLFVGTPENRGWDTIGIGDGGNEIGTGDVKADVKSLRKPDFTPVVNNGDKIAAEIHTDHMVLASVSNTGGLAVAVALDAVLGSMAPTTTLSGGQPRVGDPTGNSAARTLVQDYKGIIDAMFAQDISIDGVTKLNAQTVDGRTMHRPDGQEPQPLGTAQATHDDMFDQIVQIAGQRGTGA